RIDMFPTTVPRPCRISTMSSACSLENASRTAERETPRASLKVASVGNVSPGWSLRSKMICSMASIVAAVRFTAGATPPLAFARRVDHEIEPDRFFLLRITAFHWRQTPSRPNCRIAHAGPTIGLPRLVEDATIALNLSVTPGDYVTQPTQTIP